MWLYRASIDPSSCPIGSSASLAGFPSSSIRVRCVCRRRAEADPARLANQQASARSAAFGPRVGDAWPRLAAYRRRSGEKPALGGVPASRLQGRPPAAARATAPADRAPAASLPGAGRRWPPVNPADTPKSRSPTCHLEAGTTCRLRGRDPPPHFLHLSVDAPEVSERWCSRKRGDVDPVPVPTPAARLTSSPPLKASSRPPSRRRPDQLTSERQQLTTHPRRLTAPWRWRPPGAGRSGRAPVLAGPTAARRRPGS